MNRVAFLIIGGTLGLCALTGPSTVLGRPTPQPSAFTYQGQLKFNGQPAIATYDFECRLFDALNAGNQVGGVITPGSIEADDNGNFSMTLDFGPLAFDGSERWLQLGVRVSGGGAFTPLSPRQKIEASPYAAFALRSGLSGTYTDAVTLNNASNAINGAFSGSGAGLSSLNAGNVASGTLANARTSANSASVANSIVMRNASGGFNAGAITATSFSGPGAGLTGLNASNLATGTVAGDLLSGVYMNPVSFASLSNAFVGSFSGSGAALTSLNAANVATGNLSSLRLPTGGGWALSSNLTVDGGTLAIDAAAGNVGIGETAPARKLDLEGAANLAGGIGQMRIRDTANTVRSLEVGFSNTNTNAYLQTVKAAADTFFPRIALQPNGGSVGIGTTEPGNLLTVDGDANFTGDVGFGMALPSAPVHARSINATTGIFDRASSDGTIISLRQDGGEHGTITISGTLVSYNAFTGSHYGWCDQSIDRYALVRLNGENRRLRSEEEAEVIYGIEPTMHANDSACLGAFLGPQDASQPVGIANPLLIMAVGNGEMWVIDDGRGDIEPGEALISSDVAGCAMKDDPRRFETGYVIARAAQRVRWDDLPTDSQTGVRKARVGVLFESFVRDSRGAIESHRVQADLSRLSKENTALRTEVAELRSLVEQMLAKESNR